jgi:hypothetical protein
VDPDPHPDPHPETDPHQFSDDKPKCREFKPIAFIWKAGQQAHAPHLLQAFNLYQPAACLPSSAVLLIRIRNRIRINLQMTSQNVKNLSL